MAWKSPNQKQLPQKKKQMQTPRRARLCVFMLRGNGREELQCHSIWGGIGARIKTCAAVEPGVALDCHAMCRVRLHEQRRLVQAACLRIVLRVVADVDRRGIVHKE